MANELALDTADRVEVVQSWMQLTMPALEAIEAGAPVRLDPTTGKFRNGNGSDMTEGKFFGIALRSVAAGEAVTALRRGILDGFDLSGLNFGATVYLSDTDGSISGTAGTKAVTVGYVVAGNAQLLGSTADKLLLVDPSLAAAIS
jgi:predicted RecA/RadA family phage recombinase